MLIETLSDSPLKASSILELKGSQVTNMVERIVKVAVTPMVEYVTIYTRDNYENRGQFGHEVR